MNGLINLVVVALKAGIAGKIKNDILKDVFGQGFDSGYGKIEQYILESNKELEQLLTDKNLQELDIPRNRIEFVRAEVINLITKIKIDDSALLICRYNVEKFTKELWTIYESQKHSPIEYENDIRKTLFSLSSRAIEVAKNNEKFVQESLVYIINSNNDMHNMISILASKIDEILEILVKMNENGENKKQLHIPSRTDEYREKWEENMFLNDFDEEDEEAGINIKLREMYLLPHFTLNGQEKDLDTLEKRLFSCVEGNELRKRMLLILGQPGMGKSTLITWFVNKYLQKEDCKREVLVYKFTDFNIIWNTPNRGQEIHKTILNLLHIEERDLSRKILILDGFDEIEAGNNRVEILNGLYDKWGKNIDIEDFTLLITCRENYIEKIDRVKCSYITLQPWNDYQIDKFCNIYQDKTKKQISSIMREKLFKTIFGIPLILYMVLALDIAMEEDSSIVDIYDHIFSLEGGIYDRCLKRKKIIEWDDRHRISDIKKQIHQFSRQISIWMFENKSEEACIPKEEYEKISQNIFEKIEEKQTVLKQDVLIGNYFRLVKYYEGIETEKLQFVHRSIYEYFVAETIYSSIESFLIELSEKSKQEFARVVVLYLKEGIISQHIGEYLKHKIVNLYEGLSEIKQKKFYWWWEMVLKDLIEVGMFYYTNDNIHYYINIINKEICCFNNFLNILRLLFDLSPEQYIMRNRDTKQFEMYLRLCVISNKISKFNFSKLFLNGIDLRGMNLLGADLSEASFNYANLSSACLEDAQMRNSYLLEANLRGAILRNADLRGATLMGANLKGADLKGANLKKACILEVNLEGADLKGANLEETIWLENDVSKAINQLEEAEFLSIFIVTQGERRKITKKELFA